MEESLKSKQDAGVAWFDGPYRTGPIGFEPSGTPMEVPVVVTVPSRIKAVGDQR